jgi:hypothetical protein
VRELRNAELLEGLLGGGLGEQGDGRGERVLGADADCGDLCESGIGWEGSAGEHLPAQPVKLGKGGPGSGRQGAGQEVAKKGFSLPNFLFSSKKKKLLFPN